MSSAADAFTYLLRVRYSECDAQQVVFNARYADYVDTAVTEYYRALGIDYREMVAAGLDNQLVSLSLQWSSPARFDDVLAVRVKTLRLGTTSFTLELAFSHFHSERAIAVAEAVYVLVETSQYCKTPIPDALRQRFLDGAKGRVISHAGEAPGMH